MIQMYEPSRCLASFEVSGFQYWDGATVFSSLEPGTTVKLVAEPENPHDPSAVAIYLGETKLGYVPANMNEHLSIMLFYGHGSSFEARVLKADPEADPWKQVRVGIYVVDARD